MNVVLGVPTDIPLEITYEGNPVAYNNDDIYLWPDNDEAGFFEGKVFTGTEGFALRNIMIYALSMWTGEYVEMNLALFAPGEAYFDFDSATSGNRTLAWLREVNNATSADGLVFQVVTPGEDMSINYTFALDMSTMEIPEQLADIVYMLPGADDENASAWNFLLQLAERVSVLSWVKPVIYFDPNFELDYSGLTLVNVYF
jgi:hypothetical protein